MTLTVYNTLTRNKSAFQTIEEHKVRMYCCGMTVYDYCHLGHARTCLVWDVVRRYLQWSGYEVNYIQNFTDIDDKIIKRANENIYSYTAAKLTRKWDSNTLLTDTVEDLMPTKFLNDYRTLPSGYLDLYLSGS